MSTIRTLNRKRITLPGLRGHVAFTGSELEAEPLTAAHAPAFITLREKVEAVYIEELLLEDKIIKARARIHTYVKDLDIFASRVSKTVLTIVEDQSSHSLYITYFGTKNLSDFQRPRLGEQFVAMRGWVKLLTGSAHPSLNALAPELIALLKATDGAIIARQDAVQEKKLFGEEGARKKIFDEVNEIRKETHADLAKLPNQYTSLPVDFPDRFFLQDSGKDDDDEEGSSSDAVRASIKELEEKLAAQEDLLKKVVAAEKEKEAQEAAIKADQAALAAIEEVIAQQTAKANALKAKLEIKA